MFSITDHFKADENDECRNLNESLKKSFNHLQKIVFQNFNLFVANVTISHKNQVSLCCLINEPFFEFSYHCTQEIK